MNCLAKAPFLLSGGFEMEEDRTFYMNSRFSMYEMGLLLRLADIEGRRKTDMLRELIRREAIRQGLIVDYGELRQSEVINA